MSISSGPLKIIDQINECLIIRITDSLTGNDTDSLRAEVNLSLNSKYDIVYIDANEVTVTDLSGINEVIHSYYTLQKASKKLIFAYKRGSEIEKWVGTTGMDKFVETAIMPA